MIKHKVVHSRSKVPSKLNAFVDEVRDMYLLTLTETQMVIEQRSVSSGFYNADTFASYLRWEAY